MYKIMVVDDEQIVLDAVKFIAEKYMDNAEIISFARSGRQAIENVSNQKPDIILMDIKMPGINGIEAIKDIQSRYQDIKFIVVSAYEQFEYAKEAVTMGVVDYVLKPINRYKLIDAVNSAINEIKKEEYKKQKELENIEKLNKVIPMLEYGFIYSILMNKDFDKELDQYKDLFGINEEGGYIIVFQFGEGQSATKLKNKIGSSIKSQSFYPHFRDILKYKKKCIIGPIMLNRIIVFVSDKFESNEYDQRLDAIEFANYIVKKLKRNTDIEFFIGIGSYKNLKEINYSYDEAIKSLLYNKGEEVIHIKDIDIEKNKQSYNLRYDLENLIESIEIGEEEQVYKLTNEIFGKISKNYSDSIIGSTIDEQIRNKLMEIMIIIYRICIDAEVLEDEYLKYDEYLTEMTSIKNYEALKVWCIKRIIYITNKIKETKENKVSKVIEQAKKYININYYKDISLEDVSKEVCISPQYFSRLFKEEIGLNFIEYLTRSRIDKAQQLLKETNKSIKEICYEVGYGDPNYFSRLFKKNVGLSPTEYMKKY